MEQNKTGKYFKYAIGEILLVVVGILIALSINNWNEERKNKQLESIYLKDVHTEFMKNKVQFEEVLNEFRVMYKIADSIDNLFPITDENWAGINSIFGSAFRSYSFDPKNSSVETLINSGKIDLVKNDSLKKLLLSWKDQYLDYKEEENDLQHLSEKFYEIRMEEPSWRGWRLNLPITDDLKIKVQKLTNRRRARLNLVLSNWNVNQESKELMISIDAIISLTSSY